MNDILTIITSCDGEYADDIDAHISATHDGRVATITLDYEGAEKITYRVTAEVVE